MTRPFSRLAAALLWAYAAVVLACFWWWLA